MVCPRRKQAWDSEVGELGGPPCRPKWRPEGAAEEEVPEGAAAGL